MAKIGYLPTDINGMNTAGAGIDAARNRNINSRNTASEYALDSDMLDAETYGAVSNSPAGQIGSVGAGSGSAGGMYTPAASVSSDYPAKPSSTPLDSGSFMGMGSSIGMAAGGPGGAVAGAVVGGGIDYILAAQARKREEEALNKQINAEANRQSFNQMIANRQAMNQEHFNTLARGENWKEKQEMKTKDRQASIRAAMKAGTASRTAAQQRVIQTGR